MSGELGDPRIFEIRERLVPILEAQGHSVMEPLHRYELPASDAMPQGGAIVGNLQTRDTEGRRFSFYIRPEHVVPLVPKWFSARVRAAATHHSNIDVYLVLERESPSAERDAKACGAGVVVIEAHDELRQVLLPSQPRDQLTGQEYSRRVEEARRIVGGHAELRREAVQSEYVHKKTIAGGAGPVTQAELDRLQAEYIEWDRWRDERMGTLKGLKKTRNVEELEAFEDSLRAEIANH